MSAETVSMGRRFVDMLRPFRFGGVAFVVLLGSGADRFNGEASTVLVGCECNLIAFLWKCNIVTKGRRHVCFLSAARCIFLGCLKLSPRFGHFLEVILGLTTTASEHCTQFFLGQCIYHATPCHVKTNYMLLIYPGPEQTAMHDDEECACVCVNR